MLLTKEFRAFLQVVRLILKQVKRNSSVLVYVSGAPIRVLKTSTEGALVTYQLEGCSRGGYQVGRTSTASTLVMLFLVPGSQTDNAYSTIFGDPS